VIVTEEFVRQLKETPVCPQFHLALQSGCDSVLQRMRRRYTVDEFRRACALLREAFPDCAITTDVICGFPQETEAEFEQTCQFCREIGFARMHVFPYSARTGTKAAQMSGQVLKAVREERTRKLIAIGNELSRTYREKMLGQKVQVLCEETEDGFCTGYTDTYIHCRFQGGEPGEMYAVTVTSLSDEGVEGEI
jgi:threonylcarbamoyladenosine tRNA methylthiotransferase MtaB